MKDYLLLLDCYDKEEKEVHVLVASNLQEAKDKGFALLTDRYTDEDGYIKSQRIASAIVSEVAVSCLLDIRSYNREHHEARARKERQRAKMERAQAEYERLKAEFEGA